MKTTAVIMAGGKGERFWPQSRRDMPKQFLALTGEGQTMLQLTAERHLSIMEWRDIFVVTNHDYVDLVKRQLPLLPPENVLAEPVARNTAPCIAFAAAIIQARYGDAVMMVLASDHLIRMGSMYVDTMSQAVEVASEGETLVTVGITPTYPETGYGYINFARDEAETRRRGVYRVKRFVEKPNMETAREYLSSGEYLWNSGMFIWKVSTILEWFKRLIPETYQGAMRIKDAVGTDAFESTVAVEYGSFKAQSIDYGIMEKAKNIFTLPGNFGWDDVGSWLALERINRTNDEGNIVRGDVITISTKNSIIVGGKRLVATIGLDDIVIVDADDAILICSKENTQDVKRIIDNLKICNRTDLI